MQDGSREDRSWVVGIDLGDRHSEVCVLDGGSGEVLERRRLRTTSSELQSWFASKAPMRIILEVGTHSPWVCRLLEQLGHQVVVANARKLALLTRNCAKDDRVDAELLARLGRSDLGLLCEVQHRTQERQVALASLRARAQLVSLRAALANHCRGAVKSLGYRLPSCDVDVFATKVAARLPAELVPALSPLLDQMAELTRRIRHYDRQLDRMAEVQFPETQLLTPIRGVGTLTALAFVLTLDDPERFSRSRQVGPYLGLVPARHRSGERDPALGITKHGDRMLRALLVQCAHYILGRFGEDCDLRRFGERLLLRGGKGAKKRAAVAVARKLAVLMHSLWRRGEVYDPFYQQTLAA